MMRVLFIVLGLFSFTGFASSGLERADEKSSVLTSERLEELRAQSNFSQGYFYDWGRGQNGWGYCYQFDSYGHVMNGGYPVSNYYCEQARPSRFDWGRGQNGWGYCYQYTPYGVPMNDGQPQSNYNCERVRPSYYSWGRGNDGYTYCYQFTPYGVPMNDGRPVPNNYCR